MATEKKKGVEGVKDGFDDIVRAQRAAALETARAARMTAKLSKAFDEASNGAIDKVGESFKELIENTTLLSDKQKEELKSHKLTVTTLTNLTQKLLVAQDKIEAFSKARAEDIKKLKSIEAEIRKQKLAGAEVDAKLVDEQKAINDDLCVSLKKLGVKTNEAVKAIDAVAAETKEHAAAINGFTGNLSSSSSKIGKVMDMQKSKLLSNIETWSKVGYAMEQVVDAAKVLYGQSIRLANKGMIGSMMQINKSALSMRMSAEEFEAVIDANRDVVASLGGGAKGIENFENMMKGATSGLEHLGKDGVVVATKLFKSFYDTGFSTLNSDKSAARVYTNNVKALNKQFSMFQGAFGDTADQFADFYKQMLGSSSIQAKLNAGDTKGLDLQFKEIMARTEQLRLMHLTNEEVLALNKRFEDSFNPRENEQAQAQKEKEATLQSLMLTAMEAKRTGKDDGSADIVLQKLMSGEARKLVYEGDPQKKLDALTTGPMAEFGKAADKLYSMTDVAKKESGGRVSFVNQAGYATGKDAHNELSDILTTGGIGNAAARRGKQDKQSQEDLRTAGLANVNKDKNGDYTATGLAFNSMRVAVDQTTSVLANPFTKALWAATTALVAFGGAKGIMGLIGSIGKGGIGEAGAVAGRGVLGALSTAGQVGVGGVGASTAAGGLAVAGIGVTAAAAGGYAIGSIASKLIEGTSFQETLGGVITKVMGTLGLDDEADQKIDAVQRLNATLAAQAKSRRSSGVVTNTTTTPNAAIGKVLQTAPGSNTVARPDGSVEKVSGDRNWRNNNPGNIEYGPFAASQGAIGSDGRFAIFPDYETGRNAKKSLLFNSDKYKDKTLTDAIAKYAPPSENNTAQYQSTVLSAVGGSNKRMSDYTAQEQVAILDAMQKVEGFKAGKVTQLAPPGTMAFSGVPTGPTLASPGTAPFSAPTGPMLTPPTVTAMAPTGPTKPTQQATTSTQADQASIIAAQVAAEQNSQSATQPTATKAVVDELKTHTSLLNTMVALLGKGSPPSSRAFLLDQHAALAVH